MALDDNLRVAENLAEAARLLQAQAASAYRVNAYRRAADSIAHGSADLRAVHASPGVKGLDALPHVGLGIAAAIGEMLVTGRWEVLERLRGEADAAVLFQGIPGVGESLARRIVETLHVDSLEELRAAAEDGRLASVPHVGPRRAAALRDSLERMLGAGALRHINLIRLRSPTITAFPDSARTDHEPQVPQEPHP